MTEAEREELIKAMAKAAWPSDAAVKWEACLISLKQKHIDNARAALAVAEPAIREQCAKIAASHNGCEISIREGQWCEAVNEIAAAIREGGENA